MPLVIRAMQNNLRGSVDRVEFERDGDSIFFTYTESGVSYRLEVGFSEFKETVIDFHGEKYIVRVMGEVMEDEDRNMLYKLELLFPELPNTRMIKFSFTDEDKLLMRMYEMPNEKIGEVFLKEFNATNPKMTSYMNIIEKRIGKNVANKRMLDTFAPSLIGARVGSEKYTSIMDEEREKTRLLEKTTKFVDSVIDKLLHDDEVDEELQRGFISEIVDKIKLRIPAKPSKKKSNNIKKEESQKTK